MSRIDELIKQYCPDGVQYVGLLEACNYVRGLTYAKTQELEAGPLKVLRSNNINVDQNVLDLSDVRRLTGDVRTKPEQFLKAGDILMSAASGSRTHVGKVAFIHEDIDYVFGGFMAVLRVNERLIPRFLFHLMTSGDFSIFLDSAISSTTINNLSATLLSNFSIPVPPVEVQREIVDILDKFTQLEAELEAELEARRKQYEYYRNELLSFKTVEGGVRAMSIGEMEDLHLLKLGRGNIISRGDLLEEPGDYPVYSSSATNNGEFGRYGKYMFEDERITWSIDGGGKFFHRPLHRYSVTNVCGWLVIQDESVLLAKYVYYALLNAWATKTYDYTVKAHPSVIRNDYVLPVPPIDVQQDVVAALDCLEALVHDISIGLPAEIEARRKQYEYYRDQLLTFKELDVA